MRRTDRAAAAALLLILALPLAAQTPAKDLIKKAKAAAAAKDAARARDLYLQVIELDPDESQAYYRLAMLAPTPDEAARWLGRYTTLEPTDAWGWLALGDTLLKTGRPLEARDAYRKGAKLEPRNADMIKGAERGRKAVDPGVAPFVRFDHDSDGNDIYAFGMEGGLPLYGGFRLGGRFERVDIRDDSLRSGVNGFSLRLDARPRSDVLIGAAFGLAFVDAVHLRKESSPAPSSGILDGSISWMTLTGELRVRFRAPQSGPSLDVRLRRLPQAYSPLLLFNRVVQDDARLVGELPAGPFRLRGIGRISLIEALDQPVNSRLEGGVAVVHPFGSGGEISVQYHLLGFDHSPEVGYFAPRRVETVETGTSWELGGGDWSVSLDLGAGIQRLARQGEEPGPWKPALRGWSFFTYSLTAALQARLEIEAYSAPFAPVGTVVSENWKSLSINAGLRLRL
jgi:hypothetical protein